MNCRSQIRELFIAYYGCRIRGGSRKKYLGVWPLIIWEATTAKRNLSEITIEPINSTSSRTTVSKKNFFLGGGRGLGKIWGGGCAPWPQRRTATVQDEIFHFEIFKYFMEI